MMDCFLPIHTGTLLNDSIIVAITSHLCPRLGERYVPNLLVDDAFLTALVESADENGIENNSGLSIRKP